MITAEESQNTRLVCSSNPPSYPPTVSSEVPKVYTKLLRLIEFDTVVATHGPGMDVDELPPHKRKSNSELGPPAKQQKTIYPAYFIPELAHVIAMFFNLSQELSRHEIPNSGLQVEAKTMFKQAN
ncbi:mediator of RNA polymerase II transcription subunit 14-like [Rhagoletis pomonella]|uniref:mediator of RNA polymerase II transcription subunit 14-like n=1 Tax=Rhagoletis pomonella TaxID=28610 RepID=UPI001786342D|nr:mediator of RNA polymerase II transcription subunit 14-like [Rhagoletis pomonella]XP_036346819.1 mediator of RNA polymerase II transcription subunit 14-like [Rhagoletis pomonella]